MAHLRWRRANMKGASRLLDASVRVRSPLMLAKMFDPRLDQEALDVESRIGCVVEHAPLDGPVPSPQATLYPAAPQRLRAFSRFWD
jgi:hypothetical protein